LFQNVFLPGGIARSSFFWLPPKPITNKKIRADLPAGKKMVPVQWASAKTDLVLKNSK
jgi:hypothetical protein